MSFVSIVSTYISTKTHATAIKWFGNQVILGKKMTQPV